MNRSELRKQAQRARSGLSHLNDEANRMQNRIDELVAEVERLQAELVELRAIADKRTRDEHEGWCEREGECWLMDGPCAGHRRGKASPLLRNIEADDARLAEQEEE